MPNACSPIYLYSYFQLVTLLLVVLTNTSFTKNPMISNWPSILITLLMVFGFCLVNNVSSFWTHQMWHTPHDMGHWLAELLSPVPLSDVLYLFCLLARAISKLFPPSIFCLVIITSLLTSTSSIRVTDLATRLTYIKTFLTSWVFPICQRTVLFLV